MGLEQETDSSALSRPLNWKLENGVEIEIEIEKSKIKNRKSKIENRKSKIEK